MYMKMKASQNNWNSKLPPDFELEQFRTDDPNSEYLLE